MTTFMREVMVFSLIFPIVGVCIYYIRTTQLSHHLLPACSCMPPMKDLAANGCGEHRQQGDAAEMPKQDHDARISDMKQPQSEVSERRDRQSPERDRHTGEKRR